MSISFFHKFFGIVLGLALVTQSACSSLKPAETSSPVQENLQESIGDIGVVSARFLPRVKLQMPAKGPFSGAARGVASSAFDSIGAANIPNPIAAVVGVLFYTIVGGVNGAITAESYRSVTEKEQILKKALSEMKIQEMVRNEFMKKTSQISGYRFTLLENQGPLTEDEQPDYQRLKASGIDTVNEISVREFGLDGYYQVDPELKLYVHAEVRLISTADNKLIYRKKFLCESNEYKIPYWTSDKALRFQKELDRCYDSLAYDMTSELYRHKTLPHGTREKQ